MDADAEPVSKAPLVEQKAKSASDTDEWESENSDEAPSRRDSLAEPSSHRDKYSTAAVDGREVDKLARGGMSDHDASNRGRQLQDSRVRASNHRLNIPQRIFQP